MNVHELRPKSAQLVAIEDLARRATARFNNVLSFMEIIRHATGDEDSEVSWQPVGERGPVTFIIPKQFPVFAEDNKFGRFVFVRITDKESQVDYWIFMQAGFGGREGFLLPLSNFSPPKEVLKNEGELPVAA